MATSTVELRRPRAAPGTVMRLLQTFAALSFASYFFFWLIGLGLVIALVVAGVVSKWAAMVGVGAYLCSVAVYMPQFGRGWPFHWFLYSHFVDWVPVPSPVSAPLSSSLFLPLLYREGQDRRGQGLDVVV
jgi:hypothetical protein